MLLPKAARLQSWSTVALLQGESLPLEDVLHLRNAVLEADDLRRPVNLQDQVCESSCHSGIAVYSLHNTNILVQVLKLHRKRVCFPNYALSHSCF